MSAPRNPNREQQQRPANPAGERIKRDHEYWRQYQRKPQPPHKHNHNHNRNQHREKRAPRVRVDPYVSVHALELGLQPRPFAEIHGERAYLERALQQHDRAATELFRRLPVVEAQVQEATAAAAANNHHHHHHNDDDDDSVEKKKKKEHRHARERRAWLRDRIRDTVAAERAVLTRLGDLHVEIQCRDRWARVHRDRALLAAAADGHDPSTVLTTTTTATTTEMVVPDPLHGWCCPWTPDMAAAPGDVWWWTCPPDAGDPGPYGAGGQAAAAAAAGGREWEDGAPLWYARWQDDGAMPWPQVWEAGGQPVVVEKNANHHPSAEYAEGPGAKMANRRESLPSLRYGWVTGDEEAETGHKCLGYGSPK
ncbi:hypothetical protein F4780DRAFT_774996 [Xylariomycetidae sp. FL0641]|nr:hypothetical protein F4780DRAFT_774996 [Xylariomycetidae sp. FL0641]